METSVLRRFKTARAVGRESSGLKEQRRKSLRHGFAASVGTTQRKGLLAGATLAGENRVEQSVQIAGAGA
jgi:hypothetical protein